jgi:putative two-component system response regulator
MRPPEAWRGAAIRRLPHPRGAGEGGADRRGSAKRVLVVDDEEQDRVLVAALVASLGYEVETARDGVDALGKLELDIDVVLLDISMPRMDGFEVMRRMREEPRFQDVPVIAVTMLDGRADRLRVLQAGARDFIAKPVEMTELMVRLESQLRLSKARQDAERYSLGLEEQVARRTAQLRASLEGTAEAERRAYDAQINTIRRLVLAAELKDPETGQHIVRLSMYSTILARALGLTAHQTEVLRHAITMHDVGKIGIPDAILCKPGTLTPHERKVMESHTVIGARLLADSPSELLHEGESIALTHHERWDGTGYPRRLAGEQIPLNGRICAVVDVFDAWTSWRPYRAAVPPGVAFELVLRGRGSHFDPALSDAFVAERERVLGVHASLGEDPWVVAQPPAGDGRGPAGHLGSDGEHPAAPAGEPSP